MAMVFISQKDNDCGRNRGRAQSHVLTKNCKGIQAGIHAPFQTKALIDTETSMDTTMTMPTH